MKHKMAAVGFFGILVLCGCSEGGDKKRTTDEETKEKVTEAIQEDIQENHEVTEEIRNRKKIDGGLFK